MVIPDGAVGRVTVGVIAVVPLYAVIAEVTVLAGDTSPSFVQGNTSASFLHNNIDCRGTSRTGRAIVQFCDGVHVIAVIITGGNFYGSYIIKEYRM